MQIALADELIGRTASIIKIGNQKEHNKADQDKLQRLYFEIAVITVSNLVEITNALHTINILKAVTSQQPVSKEQIAAQVAQGCGPDTTSN